MLHASSSYLGAGIGGCTAREEDARFVRVNGRETRECAMDRLSWGEERRIRYAQPPCSRGRESSWVYRFSLSSEGAGRGGGGGYHRRRQWGAPLFAGAALRLDGGSWRGGGSDPTLSQAGRGGGG